MAQMQVGLFAAPEHGHEVKGLMQSLRGLSIHARGMTIADGWTRVSGDALERALAASTHLVLFPTSGSTSGNLPEWAVYLLGYGAGRSLPIAVVGVDDLPEVYAHGTPVTPEQLETYLIAERGVWERTHRIELARTRLRGREHDPDAFYQSAASGDLQAVEDFLAVGTDVNVRSSSGAPGLVGGVRGRSVSIVQRLVSEGADPNAACGADGISALCEAASMGEGTIVGVLLANDADPNQTTGNGQSALMLAASQGHSEVVEQLLSAGADPSYVDSLGMTAASYARLFGKEEIVNALERFSSS